MVKLLVLNPGIKLIHCILGMTLNSTIVVQGMTVKLRPGLRFERVDETVSDGKNLQERAWIVCLADMTRTFELYYIFKVRHGDNVTKLDYYY